jgi:hypothetical protein
MSRKGKVKVAGVGPDAKVVTNAKGAKQSATLYRVDLTPPLAALAVAGVLAHGAEKYGEWNWLGIPAEDHLNHAMIHAFAYLAGDGQDDHLEHFACRALMALEIRLREKVDEADRLLPRSRRGSRQLRRRRAPAAR